MSEATSERKGLAVVVQGTGSGKSTEPKLEYPIEIKPADHKVVREYLGIPASMSNKMSGQNILRAAMLFASMPAEAQAKAEMDYTGPVIPKIAVR